MYMLASDDTLVVVVYMGDPRHRFLADCPIRAPSILGFSTMIIVPSCLPRAILNKTLAVVVPVLARMVDPASTESGRIDSSPCDMISRKRLSLVQTDDLIVLFATSLSIPFLSGS
jgi:hypothetical protein